MFGVDVVGESGFYNLAKCDWYVWERGSSHIQSTNRCGRGTDTISAIMYLKGVVTTVLLKGLQRGTNTEFWNSWRNGGQPQMQSQEPRESESAYSKYDSQSFNEFQAPDVTAWKLARTIIEHENLLVNHRLTWLMTSQAFLFAVFSALFVAWGRGELQTVRPLIPCFILGDVLLGMYICLVIQTGLYRAFHSLDNITKHYYGIVKNSFGISQVENQEIPSTRTPPLHYWNSRHKYIDQFYLPSGMAVAWVILLLSVGAYILPETKEVISTFLGIGVVIVILLISIILVLIAIFTISPRELR